VAADGGEGALNSTATIWPDLFIATAERYEHSAIFVHPNPGTFEECARLIDLIRGEGRGALLSS
jgi:hypothetical protein